MEKGQNSYKDTCLIIGNGCFDIKPTSYGNFVDSEQFNNMVARGNELAIHLKNKYELQNWIDIENELKLYSMENEDPSFKFNYELLTYALVNCHEKLDYTLIKRSRVVQLIG